jgi:hypothetical protein
MRRRFGSVFNQLAAPMSSPVVSENLVGVMLSEFPSDNKVSGDTSGAMEGKLLAVAGPALLAVERCKELEDTF